MELSIPTQFCISNENACGHMPVNLIAGAEIKILNHIYLLFNHNIQFKVNAKEGILSAWYSKYARFEAPIYNCDIEYIAPVWLNDWVASKQNLDSDPILSFHIK